MIKKINLHFIDKCNFNCPFCFVKKEKKELTINQLKYLVNKVAIYFNENKITDGCINLAGGEPLCSSHIQEVIDYIVSKKMKVSLITNGSLLTEEFINKNKNKLTMIGISIDSFNDDTNRKLGRCSNKTLSFDKVLKLAQAMKKNGILFKINTCVSKVNLHENLSPYIKKLNPDRFKLIQIYPENKYCERNSITNKEFDNYCNQYKGIHYVKEYSTDLENSYLIIDSKGNLSTNNRHCSNYSLLGNKKISDYLNKEVKINKLTYQKRYKLNSQNNDQYLFFDLEFASTTNSHKICEFGYVITDNNFRIIEKNNLIINPHFDIRKWDENALQILTRKQKDYENGKKFSKYYSRIKNLFKNKKYIFGHTTYIDAIALNQECKRYNLDSINYKFYDIRDLICLFLNLDKDISLKNMVKRLNINETYKFHDAENDSYYTMKVLEKMISNKNLSLKEVLKDCNKHYINQNFEIKKVIKK